MSDFEPQADAATEVQQTTSLEVDAWGIKGSVNLTPQAAADANEHVTLASLRESVWQSILRCVRDAVGLVADVFTGARGVVRGAGASPLEHSTH